MRMHESRAFTVIEILFVVVIMGIVAAVVIPRADRGEFFERRHVYSVARQFMADIRLARRLSIANGSSKPSGYAFDLTGGSPYTGWRVLDIAASTTVGQDKTIDNTIVRVTGIQSIAFDTVGGATYSGSNITLRDEATPRNVRYRINLTATTGRVTLTELD